MLTTYTNGNYSVILYENGRKIRRLEKGNVFKPAFPETIDLKITDWCNAGCAYCHEDSTIRGKHANLKSLLGMLEEVPAGTELALGGGDPMMFPDLYRLLRVAKDLGHICNITVNIVHLKKHLETLLFFQQHKLLYGIGISALGDKLWSESIPMEAFGLQHTVIHVINGLADFTNLAVHHRLQGPYSYDQKGSGPSKPHILILGYKYFRRGNTYAEANGMERKLKRNQEYFGNWLYRALAHDWTVSFDNLAIEQLRVKELIKPEAWDKFYMGDDGQFSMFIDAVKEESAMSSTSIKRESWDNAHPLDFWSIERSKT